MIHTGETHFIDLFKHIRSCFISSDGFRLMAGQGIQPTQVHHALRATLALRIFAVLIAAFTLSVRGKLPAEMAAWYELIAPPLFCLNLAGFVFAKPLVSYLERHPSWLAADLNYQPPGNFCA
jgi:hypothetical protein